MTNPKALPGTGRLTLKNSKSKNKCCSQFPIIKIGGLCKLNINCILPYYYIICTQKIQGEPPPRRTHCTFYFAGEEILSGFILANDDEKYAQ